MPRVSSWKTSPVLGSASSASADPISSKRLESSGAAFIQSVERHVLRNHVFLYALENDELLPIGPQDAEMLDARLHDEDVDAPNFIANPFDADDTATEAAAAQLSLRTPNDFRARAAEVYYLYTMRYHTKFKWIRTNLFADALSDDLASDADRLIEVLQSYGAWDAAADEKLNALENLLTQTHPYEKVLVFTQFADTVRYLKAELSARGVSRIEEVTGDSPNPTALAHRFSPVSNNRRARIAPSDELRVLVSTDILSEGQNLQDCAVVVNYDLPWAIIRLVQRAGRVDRIGQEAEQGSSATPSCPQKASNTLFSCVPASARVFFKTPKSSAPTRHSSKMMTNPLSSTSTTNAPACSTTLRTTTLISLPMPTKSGRTQLPKIRILRARFPNSSARRLFHQAAPPNRLRHRKACFNLYAHRRRN